MRLAPVVLVAVMAALNPLAAAAAGRADYWNQILAQPTSSDERAYQRAFHGQAQGLSDRMFNAVAKVLGGSAPRLNFVPKGSTRDEHGFSANLSERQGYPRGTINVDTDAVQWLLNQDNTFHDSAVNTLPHEFAHLRQTPDVLRSDQLAEGGAQSFADIVTPLAAAAAKTRYAAGNFDGAYSEYVKYVNANKGRDWVLGSQFGKPPVSWP